MPSDKSPEHSDSESDPIGGGSNQEFVTDEGVFRLMHEQADKILNDKLKEMRDEISQVVEDIVDDRHNDVVSTLVDNTIDLIAPKLKPICHEVVDEKEVEVFSGTWKSIRVDFLQRVIRLEKNTTVLGMKKDSKFTV